jgi:SAM-dependent methyltransferase
MTDNVHAAASQGYARQAAAYERGRPDYPQGVATWLAETLWLGPGRIALDVGAGTGKFTRLMLATGASVVAVEPVEAMRQRLAAIDGVQVVPAPAQSIPLQDQSVDAIVCAQSFHWFAGSATLDEFARLLKPGGRLGLIWNIRDESVDWVARITDLITPFEGDAPRFYKGDWKKPFPHPEFTPLRETAFAYAHVGPPQEVIIDRFMSVSFIAALPPRENRFVRAQLESLIATHPALAGRAEISFPYRTLAFDCERR